MLRPILVLGALCALSTMFVAMGTPAEGTFDLVLIRAGE